MADPTDLRETPVDEPPAAGAAADTPSRPPGITVGQSVLLFAGLLLFMATPPAAVVGTAKWLGAGKGTYRAEIVLPAVLLVGVVSLLAVLTMMVLVFQRLDLTSQGGALGLPDGSIQAVIALALILIFAIVGVYLHGVAGHGEVRKLSSLSRAQLDALPASELVSVRGTGGGRWQAVLEPRNEQQDDLAKQLLTTISTLVVAVAGFYFGSKSVREATRAGAAAARGDSGPTTVVAGPASPTAGGEGEDVDETSAYGERSPVTGLGQTDVEDEIDGGPDTAAATAPEPGDESAAETGAEAGAETGAEAAPAAVAEEPFEEHPDYQDEPDFYPDEEDEAVDADEDSPPAAAEGDDEDKA